MDHGFSGDGGWWDFFMSLTRLARRHAFQTLDSFANSELAAAVNENPSELGPCLLPGGYGHNFALEAYFEGGIEKQSGMILNLAEVDSLLARAVAPLNGKKLSDANGNLEDLASYVAQSVMREMKSAAPRVRLVKVRLYESQDFWVDVWP